MATQPMPVSDVAAAWAPRTKLLRPDPDPDAVVRPALVSALLAAVRSTPVTIVTAQAGAGKTTLVATIAAATNLPTAWVTLDAGDDDLASVAYLLGLAVGSVVPGGCPALVELVESGLPAALDPRRAIGVLVNDVLAAEPPPFLVIIDDVHTLTDPSALAVLDQLALHAPPALHLLLTSRHDPPLSLSRLRASRRLAEVRGDDLRLDTIQADALLNGRLGLGLDVAAVGAVVAQAAGWAAGVHLLGRSLDHGSLFGRTDIGDPAVLFDYLTDEILARQPTDVLRLLEDTSVLPILTPASARAVTGRADAPAVIADLHRSLHFLVLAVDPAADAYRYHDLFADLLRRRLAASDPIRLAGLHRLAAAAADDPARRIDHLLAAGDTAAAADVVEAVGRGASTDTATTRRCASWIGHLPADIALARPWLRLLLGVAAVGRGEHQAGVALLEGLLAPFAEADDLLGRFTATRQLHLVTKDHARFGPAMAEMAADPRFADLPPTLRVEHQLSSAYGTMFEGRWPEAATHLAAAVGLATSTGDAGSAEALALHLSPLLATIDGCLGHLETTADWLDARTSTGPSLLRLGVHHQRAIAHFFRGRFAGATDAAASGRVVLERLGGQPFLRSSFDWITAMVWFAHGELARAEAQLRSRQTEPAATDLDADLDANQLPLWLRVLRAQGRVEEVAAVAARGVPPSGSLVAGHRAAVLLACDIQVALAAGATGAAIDGLRRAVELEDRMRISPFVGSARIDLAVALAQTDAPDEAWRALAHALRTAETRGMPGLVAQAGPDVVGLLELAVERGLAGPTAMAALAALGQRPRPSPVAVPGSDAMLSRREVEVLRLLADGASNRQIADGLYVSEHTAKTHVRHLLTKLGVTSRGLAAARARDEHLV